MLSPDMFRRFCLKPYQKVTDFLKEHGVKVCFVDCDGNIEALLPLWLEGGVRGFYPLEVAADMDAEKLLKQYQKDKILLWGNDPTVEQVNICKALKPDIAILQRSVKPEDIEKKAKFAAAIGCKVLIPHHHDFKAVDGPEVVGQFREAFLRLVPDGVFLTPEHGKWMEL
jgi:hypothetical protein